MSKQFASAVALILLIAATGTGQENAHAGLHALLIGCTKYPGLSSKNEYDLGGPGNDVELTADLLKQRFDFSDNEITTLVHVADPAKCPTRGMIVRAFDDLVGRVKDGDSVFILLAGHGSQQPDDNSDENDGQDEVFLVEDSTPDSGRQPFWANAIVDDQIRGWLDALRDRGAHVLFVADTCNAGTMDRGPIDATDLMPCRGVDPRRFFSRASLDQPRGQARNPANFESTDNDLAENIDADGATRGRLIALYAVPAGMSEWEHLMPTPGGGSDKRYGRLAYALNRILSRASQPITYRELAQQLRWWYAQWQWYPVGYLQGAEQDWEVLGKEIWPDRSAVIMTRNPDDSLSLNVGSLHGITADSIFAAYPLSGSASADQVAGYVKVVAATPVAATVQPCPFKDQEAVPADQLPSPARCQLAQAGFDDLKLVVSVAPLDPGHRDAAAEVQIQAAVEHMAAQDRALVRPAKPGEAADVYALPGDRGIFLRRPYDVIRRGDETIGETDATTPSLFGPIQREAGWEQRLEKSLATIARVANLRRLVSNEQESQIGGPLDPKIDLKITVSKWNPQSQKFEIVDPTMLTLTDDDRVRVEVRNAGRLPADVTILYVESGYEIISLFPTARDAMIGDFDNRISRNGRPAVVEFTINDTTVGLEDVIVIATHSDGTLPPQNFAFLQQTGLEQARSAVPRSRGNGRSVFDTPLGQLVASAAYGTRGLRQLPDIADYEVQRVSWLVRKRDAAAKPSANQQTAP